VVVWLDAADEGRGGSICVWGNSPVLYFEANRPLGCRFVFANYLTGASPATATQTEAAVDSSRYVVREAWPMLERDLDERRPRFIIDASPGDVAFYGKYPPWKFPRLARVLDCAYEPAADVAGMRIYQRRAAPCDRRSRIAGGGDPDGVAGGAGASPVGSIADAAPAGYSAAPRRTWDTTSAATTAAWGGARPGSGSRAVCRARSI
jgi:hypothetical protein